MTTKVFKALSVAFSPKIAKSFQSVEESFDEHYLKLNQVKGRNIKKSHYKFIKGKVFKILIEESLPNLLKRSSEELVKFTLKREKIEDEREVKKLIKKCN